MPLNPSARIKSFLEQTKCFKERVLKSDPSAKFHMNNSPSDDGKNWFISWYPGGWKRPRSNFGVHWELTCPVRGGKPSDVLRISLGAEAPLLEEHKIAFKRSVVDQAAFLHGADFDLFPNTRGKGKIARGPEIPLLPEGAQLSYELYRSAAGLNAIVREAIDEFNRLARFDPPLIDP